MPSENSLEELLARTRLRDRIAFAQLYSATSAKLFGICLRILKDRQSAQDALQEIYVKIWYKADSYSAERGKPITWMSRIAHNYAIDRLRVLKSTDIDIDAVTGLADPKPNPEQITLASDSTRQLNLCLDELEELHATAIRSAYLDGYTYQEISQKIDIPVNTIKTWMRRSLVKLKDCLNR